MPAIKCWKKHCGFSSDDLVGVLLLAALVRFLMLCGAIAIALYIYLELGDCRPSPYGLLIFYIFGTLLLQLLVLTVEWCMFIVSKTGGIMQTHLRKSLIGWLIVRFVLVWVEAGMSVVGGVTAWNCKMAYNEACIEAGVYGCVLGFTVVSWLAVCVASLCFGILIDPFSCYSPATITHVEDLTVDEKTIPDILNGEGYNLQARVLKTKRSLPHLGAKKKEHVVDEKGKKLYNPKTKHLWQKSLNKIKCTCCKEEGHEHQSTMESIAQDLSILFDGEGYVPSDLVAALVLTMEEQQPFYDCLIKSLRKKTIEQMEGDQFVGGKDSYQYQVPMAPNAADVQELQEAMHFFPYSMGVYGWPIYCFDRPLRACFHLPFKIGPLCGCGACHRTRNYTFGHIAEDTCGCNTAALALTVGLSKRDIVYVSYHNEIFKAPFAVLLDRERKTVVIAIRGTMSLSDVLTDLSISLETFNIEHEPYDKLNTLVHKGMLLTAANVLGEMKSQKVFESIKRECEDSSEYSITVVGHSLGAGVASVLALLLKTGNRPESLCTNDIKCYAYEPPGCVFSYPLAEFSKSFITTVVLNNDLVPSLNWRSLLLLKRSMLKHLDRSTDPKYKILYRGLAPRCLSASVQKDEEDQHDSFVHTVFEKPNCLDELGKLKQKPITSFRGAATTVVLAQRWKHRGLHDRRQVSVRTCEEISEVCPVPTFIPGKVFHIKEFKEPSCCPGFTKTGYHVSCSANEDFGVLRLGEKALDSHLPNTLCTAFKVLKKQLEHGQSLAREGTPTRPEGSPENCPGDDFLENYLSSAAPPPRTTQGPSRTQALRSEDPRNGAHTAAGRYWHSGTRGSYELQHVNSTQQRQGANLTVVADVPERARGPISYV